MKLISQPRHQGSMLVITVCMAAIIGTGLVSYLWLIQSKNRLVSRSLYWNMAMAHAEAGVEEAMAQLNHKFDTNVNRAANGWGGPANGYYGPVTRTLKTGAYRAKISTDKYPIIISTGYATNPIKGDTITRTIQVQARFESAFQVAMAAKLDIKFKGNDVHIDSYDSTYPNVKSDASGNYLASKAQHNGNIATTDGITDVQNANINGKIQTGPNGNISFGPNGYAGPYLSYNPPNPPTSWTGPGLYSPDWWSKDFNADFKDVEPPFDPTFAAPPNSYAFKDNKTNFWELKEGDYYFDGNPNMNNVNIIVTGNARLWVTGNYKPNTSQEIFINEGVWFKVYVGKTSGSDVSAEFGQVNTAPTANAATFQYYGLPTNKSLLWKGNQEYKGTVYTPQATFECGGGGSEPYDYQGACVVYEVVMNGHFNFHFDESLKNKNPYSGYAAGMWLELSPLAGL